MLLQKQYRETCFKKYYELISCLLVSEQTNELFPEVNAISSNQNSRGSKGGEGRYNYRPNDNKNTINHQKWKNNKNYYPEDVGFSSIF